MLIYAILLAALICLSRAQELLSVLAQQPSLSQFSSYLQKYPDLVETLNSGTFTGDDAHSQGCGFTANHWKSWLLATLLTNTTYANVTGGQRVKCTTIDGKPTVISGVQAASHIIHADVIFLGGLVHIIDEVLAIPLWVLGHGPRLDSTI